MKEIKLFECRHCDPPEPCVADNEMIRSGHINCSGDTLANWETLGIYVKKPEPEESKFEFGQEVECRHFIQASQRWEWIPAKFVCEEGRRSIKVLGREDVGLMEFCKEDVRLPIKDRIRRGQPVMVRNFLHEEHSVVIIAKMADRSGFVISTNNQQWSDWRLPTKAELEEIGHGGLGWLSEEKE